MEALARAIILATKFLDNRASDDEMDDDVEMLESISDELQRCSMEEKRCLIRVAHELGFESWPDEMGIL